MASQEKHHTHTLISVIEKNFIAINKKTIESSQEKKMINETFQKLII